MEIIETLGGFVLTLVVIFGYLLEDIIIFRFIYRLAVYLFVGLAAAYTAIVTVEGVLLPLLVDGSTVDLILFFVALLFVVLLLFKGIKRLAWFSNLVIAFIIAVGTVVALIGAISGTLIPLTLSTSNSVGDANTLDGVVIVLGVITSLIYFQYWSRQQPDPEGPAPSRSPVASGLGGLHRVLRLTGKGFIVIALGALYGAAILTSLTILSDRIAFLLSFGG